MCCKSVGMHDLHPVGVVVVAFGVPLRFHGLGVVVAAGALVVAVAWAAVGSERNYESRKCFPIGAGSVVDFARFDFVRVHYVVVGCRVEMGTYFVPVQDSWNEPDLGSVHD